VAVYDGVAEHYDATRGGERRGDEFAAMLDARLPAGEGPILEVGVGTGVVALGLRTRGRAVVGVDLSAAMLKRAGGRLGPVVARADARALPVATASVAHAVSVWVIHAVDGPASLFAEVARVLRPGGRYLVCPTNRDAASDPITSIIGAMFERAAAVHPTWRPNVVDAARVLDLASAAGLSGEVVIIPSREWETTPAEQLRSIRDRVWPGLLGLDDRAFEDVTAPAVAALRALPDGPITRRALTDLVVLRRP
jgi:ubiquinone/menaquinone biosynthesis C-methylase UbiE